MKDEEKIMEDAEDVLSALNSAFDCFDDDDDIETAVAMLNGMQKGLRSLLPELGIYAWSFDDGSSETFVRAFPTEEEAEAELQRDIATVQHEDEDGMLRDGGTDVSYVKNWCFNICWKRFYEKEETE